MLFEDTYKTIVDRSEGLYKEKGSKFIAKAIPVADEKEIKDKLNEIKTEYHDARHHCFACLIGPDKSYSRFNDDGEPSGTAGRPIMGQINSNDLTNILVVVVRYFGGTKLGVRGLINAYKTAASEAISSAKVISKTVDEIYEVGFEYLLMNQVMKIVKDEKLTVLSQNFELKCTLTYRIRKKNAPQVMNKFKSINGLKVRYLYTE